MPSRNVKENDTESWNHSFKQYLQRNPSRDPADT